MTPTDLRRSPVTSSRCGVNGNANLAWLKPPAVVIISDAALGVDKTIKNHMPDIPRLLQKRQVAVNCATT